MNGKNSLSECHWVLAGLPMLLKEGLLNHAREFLSLPKGYYGLTTVLLFLAFLVLARVRNPEALRHQVPGNGARSWAWTAARR